MGGKTSLLRMIVALLTDRRACRSVLTVGRPTRWGPTSIGWRRPHSFLF